MRLIAPLAAIAALFAFVTAEAHECTIQCETPPPSNLQNVQEVWTGNVVAGDPSVVETASGFLMTYTDGDIPNDRAIIGRVESTDGINWTPSVTPDPDPGIILRGRTTSEAVETNAIVDVGTFWLLYVTAYDLPITFMPADLYLLTSGDGVTFAWSFPNPIIPRTPGWYTNDAIYGPDVIWDPGRLEFVMAYNAFCFTDCTGIPEAGGGFAMIATSVDGVNWVEQSTPTIAPDLVPGSWMEDDIKNPSIVKHGAEYLLFFTGDDVNQISSIGMAYADDIAGPWTIVEEPILQALPGSFYHQQVMAPSVVMDGDTVRMWFMAVASNTEFTIGYGEALLSDLR